MKSVSILRSFLTLLNSGSCRLLLAAGALTLVAGCCVGENKLSYYNGPTEPMSQVVAAINANNAKIPTLYAHHYFEADIVDDKHQSHHVSGDGVLLYMAPDHMRLRGSAGLIGNVFDLGCNPQSYWLKLSPSTGDTMWWGTWANLVRLNPDEIGIPVRPDQVLDVLGITPFDWNFNELPAPIMRFNNEGNGSYVFVWIGKLPDRWVALREVWYDRVSKRPSLALLYDTNGRVVMRAEFKDSDFRQVAVDGVPKAQWPYMPGNYRLIFPESGSRLVFSLDEAMLKSRSGPITIPNPKSFIMPNPQTVDVKNVYEIAPPPPVRKIEPPPPAVPKTGPATRHSTRPATEPTTKPRVQNGK